jgi:3-hydroxyacyl-[acyl-carrier-protein] dehydratase
VTFVFLDRLLELEPGARARFVKCCALSEDYFMQHFPGFPVMPGALVMETFIQAATVFLAASNGFTRWPVVHDIARARFRRFVRPGDRLEVRVRRTDDGRIEAVGEVDGQCAVSAELGFLFPEPPADDPLRLYDRSLDAARAFVGVLAQGGAA